jgi:hypothetical protein
MKPTLVILAASLAILSLTGCSLSLLGTPTPFPTSVFLASPTSLSPAPATAASSTPGLPTVTLTLNLPTVTPGPALPTATAASASTPLSAGIIPGGPSGPYGVTLLFPEAALTIHSAPGAGSSASGSFAGKASDVMRTGPSANAGEEQWVQVQNPGGGTGWVPAANLTEYVTPAEFCADGRVNTLLTDFGNAIKTSNGKALYSLVSPLHGVIVRLWRNGNAIPFYPKDAQWFFETTYEHHWGAAPGSGQDTVGSFHAIVLPKWLDVLNAPAPGFTLSCNIPQTGGASYDTSWPASYANVNFYSLYKPGPAGNENSWRTLLVGVEYVQGQPYIFSVTQLDWEP